MRKTTLITIFMLWLIASLPVVHAETSNLVTDANGNLISGDGLYREYNSLNQLVNVRNGSTSSAPLLQQFVYHPSEERVHIKRTFNSSGNLIEAVYYISKSFVQVLNASGQYNFTFVFHEGQLITQEMQGTKLFIHGNHEGSSSVVTNSTGQIVERTEYSPLGEVVAGGGKVRFDHEGKESDSLVGDTDFNFRKYKSEWGLFTQPDTLIQNVYDPQALNRYMFERGNPYKYTDPDGHIAPLVAIGLALLVAIAVTKLTIYATETYGTGKTIDEQNEYLWNAAKSEAIGLGLAGTAKDATGAFKVITEVTSDAYELQDAVDPLLNEEHKKDEFLEATNKIKKVDLTNQQVTLTTYDNIPVSKVAQTYNTLQSRGWRYVSQDGDKGNGYWCLGSGCPGNKNKDETPKPSEKDKKPNK